MQTEYDLTTEPEFNQDLLDQTNNVAAIRINPKAVQVADVHDFLKDEEERQQHRKRHIEAIKQDSIDREEKHQESMKELTDLHQHALANNAELLKQLGHVEPPSWVGNPEPFGGYTFVMPVPQPIPAPKRRGRPAGVKNAAKSATPVETAAPAKRTMSQETKDKMAAARAKYWTAKKKAAKKAAKAK